MDDEVRRIGPFRLLERIGEGGMGTVWLAERRTPVEQRVALKVIRTDRLDETYRARFAMEQQALARMDHPGIARLFDAGEADGQSWYAMEHVPGQTLADYCLARRLPIEDRLRLFLQICDGVQHAHQRGILHRDLKPGNVLVREIDGRPHAKIIDFGLAQPVDPMQIRATLHEAAHTIVGTLAYMSPEQADRIEGDLDVRTDVYSLGVVLYELLTGELPIGLEELRRNGLLQVGAVLREHSPRKPSTRLSQLGERLAVVAAERSIPVARLCARVRGDLDVVTLRAIAPDRRQRYESVRDFARDVERVLAHRPVEARAPSTGYLLRKWVRRHRRGVAAAAVLALGAAVFGAFAHELTAAARLAEARRQLVAKGAYVGDLLRQADEELWPAAESGVPAMTAWLRQTAGMESLAVDLQDYRAVLEEGMRDSSTESVAFAESQLRSVATGLVAARRLPAIRARVEARRARAISLRQRTLVDHADAWLRARREVAADARFAGFALPDVPGLVPLGRNPRSGLQEFYLLDSGTGPLPRCREDGTYAVTAATGLIFVLVPGGEFRLGNGEGAPSRRLRPFFVSRYEMTGRQWAFLTDEGAGDGALAAADPSERLPDGGGPTHPVQHVSWLQCRHRLRCAGLALPTFAQWIWASNGALESDLRHAWYDKAQLGAWINFGDACLDAFNANVAVPPGEPSAEWDGFPFTCPVDARRPNPFGLHGVFGNVAEFVRDACSGELPATVTGDAAEMDDPTVGGMAFALGASYATRWVEWEGAMTRQLFVGNVESTTGVRPIVPMPAQNR